jgi:hypothetical protein
MRNAKTTMKRYLIYLFCFISITLYANDKKENCLLPRFPEERIEDFQDNYDSLINIHQTKYGAFVEFKKEFIQMTKRFPFMYGDIIVSFNNCKIENGNLVFLVNCIQLLDYSISFYPTKLKAESKSGLRLFHNKVL